MGTKTKLSILICLFLLITGFQNCDPNSAGASAGFNRETDSGTPYEGKIYVSFGRDCTDKTEFHSRIVLLNASQAQLDRENCHDIQPIPLSVSDYQLSADSRSLIYKNQGFSSINVNSVGITHFLFSNDAQNFFYSYSYGGQPTWLQIFLDTDNNSATGYSQHGLGADYLIENDHVWKYSAQPGAPQSTWAWRSIVSANLNNVAPNVSWSFPRAAIGSPVLIKLIGQTSLGARTEVITQVPK